jgi:hypothetical protein
MQILSLLGMYFDAVVVEVEKYLLFSDWLWPYFDNEAICFSHQIYIKSGLTFTVWPETI